MKNVFAVSDSIVSPLGQTTAENFTKLRKGESGIRIQEDGTFCPNAFYGSLFERSVFAPDLRNAHHTKFEQLLITSITDALNQIELKPSDAKTVLIISSTKGNIDLMDSDRLSVELSASRYGSSRMGKDSLQARMSLWASADLVAAHFGFVHPPIVVSHACISGVLALLTGMRLIQAGIVDNAVIAGSDTVSKFVLTGFQSFQAISPEPCRPFDAKRRGISLGEGAAAIILSNRKEHSTEPIRISGGAVTNDANHISGPSRTGEELCMAIQTAIHGANLVPRDINFICAHGTATLFNDEMETKAITLATLESVPTNSLKGYFGHTLGAAGLIESAISIASLKYNVVLGTKGFSHPGTSKVINICREPMEHGLNHCLKTASGFGGCNAALVFSKQY